MSWLSAATLLLPVLAGVGAGAVRIFDDPKSAIGHLNRYALYFAFPALVFRGIANAQFALPTAPTFWLTVPVALAVALGLLRALARVLGVPRDSGSMALVVSFGNVAYLGLPIAERALGEAAVGVASLAVAIHVLFAMAVGPTLLLRWSGRAAEKGAMGRLLRQPLLWAPVVGLAVRAAPDLVGSTLSELLGPIGASAAPVALFLLGLYLHGNARELAGVDRSALTHAAGKVLMLPTVTLCAVLAARAAGLLPELEAKVLVLLSAMPTAITTFAISHDFGVGERRVTQAIVLSTLIAALTVPAVVFGVTTGWP